MLGSTRVIREDESGLVIKRFGPPLPSGRIIALNGEAGYQARLLSPGWHFGLWRWRYKVARVPMVVIQPGEIALVVAADGEAIPPERVLARAVRVRPLPGRRGVPTQSRRARPSDLGPDGRDRTASTRRSSKS